MTSPVATSTLGKALAAKDFNALADLLHPEIDSRGYPTRLLGGG